MVMVVLVVVFVVVSDGGNGVVVVFGIYKMWKWSLDSIKKWIKWYPWRDRLEA